MPWSVTLLGGRHASAPAICGNVPDSLYLFTLTRERHLMLRRFDGRWSRWMVVSSETLGDAAPAAIVLGRSAIHASGGAPADESPAAQQRSRAARDLVHVFARGSTDHVLHLVYTGGRAGTWADLGGETRHSPAVCAPAPAELMVFVTAPGGGIRSRRFHEGNWLPWESLDGPPGGSNAGLTVTADRETGQIDLVARSPSGLWQRRYRRAHGWAGWHAVPGQEIGQPALAYRHGRSQVIDGHVSGLPEGRLDLFARDAGARLTHNAYDHDWQGWTRVADVVLVSHPAAIVGPAPVAFYVAALGRNNQMRLFEYTTQPAPGRTLFLDVNDDGDPLPVDDDLEDDDDPTSLVSRTSNSTPPTSGDPPGEPPPGDPPGGEPGGEGGL